MVGAKLRGRPPLGLGKAKRASFNTRLRPALKLALETAAKEQGRSLSEEIEFRLERSLDEERLQNLILRNGILCGLLMAFPTLDRKAADILDETGLLFEITAFGELPAAHNELVKALWAMDSAEGGKHSDAVLRKIKKSIARFAAALKKAVTAEEGHVQHSSAAEPPQ